MGSWWFFGGDQEDETEEPDPSEIYEEQTVTEEYSIPFERKTRPFTFVRGTEKEITWDEWKSVGGRKKGKSRTHRADTWVERFEKIIGGDNFGKSGGEFSPRPESVVTDEVSTPNVAHRGQVETKQMELVAVVEWTIYVDDDGVEQDRKWWCDEVMRYEIREVSDDGDG